MRRRDFSLNVFLAIVASAIVIAIVYGAQVFSTKTEQLADAAFDVGGAQLRMSSALTGIMEAESSQRGYLITRDESYLEPLDLARTRVRKALEDSEAKLQSLQFKDAPGRLKEFQSLVDRKFAELDQTIALAREGKGDQALAVVRGNLGRDLTSRARDLVAEEQASLADLRAQTVASLRDSARKLTLLTSLGVVVVVVLSTAAVAQVSYQTRQLNRAQESLASANEMLEERVRERTRELSRANEEIQRYAYVVSHDLRAPLINIVGFTKELETAAQSIKAAFAPGRIGQDDPVVAEAARAVEEDLPEALKFIESSTSRMDHLIAAILTLSRLGRVPLKAGDIDLEELVGDCIASVQHRANEANARISIEGRLPHAISDRAALEQVVGNLLDNALKYLSPERPGEIAVRGKRAGQNVLLEIEDNGRGIAPTDQQRIFELFRRAGKQDRPGEGLGLAHARSLLRRLGGEIAVTSDGTSGSIFSLTLPCDLRQVMSEGKPDA